MIKSNVELLAIYRKANKKARERIIVKSGYSSEQEYLDSLQDGGGIHGGKLGTFFKSKDSTEDGALDQVICFDTTGSMNSYIAAVRAHVTDLIPKLFNENKNLRVKIVAFGDYCDMHSVNNFGNAYQECELTNDQNKLINFVKNAKGTSGGDTDESYELVIKKVVEETPWREHARKAVLLIADCGPHPLGYSHGGIISHNTIDWKEEARKSAEKGISWDTLSCGYGWTDTFYKPLSNMTNGVNLPFQSSGKTQVIVDAVTSVRGSSASKDTFLASYMATSTMDTELMGSYKALGDLLEEDDLKEKFRSITKSKEEEYKKLKKK